VEYSPPQESVRFATLDLVIPTDEDKAKIVQAMESELRDWLGRYPIPLMVSAFDATGSLIHLDPVKDDNFLIGFVLKGQEAASLNWRPLKDQELPDDALNRDHLRKVYSDIPFRTNRDIERECKKHARMILTIKRFVFFGTIVVPLLVIILPEISRPIALIVLVYSILKIVVKFLKQTGKLKKSPRQVEQEREELQMRHHHHHCKKNPQAFQRLRSENVEREERERIRKEAESLNHSR
jgi:hypothetical protein